MFKDAEQERLYDKKYGMKLLIMSIMMVGY